MKANLKKITFEMTGNTELTETINENFDTLNDFSDKREILILNRIESVKTTLLNVITNHHKDEVTHLTALTENINSHTQNIEKTLNVIVQHLGIDSKYNSP